MPLNDVLYAAVGVLAAAVSLVAWLVRQLYDRQNKMTDELVETLKQTQRQAVAQTENLVRAFEKLNGTLAQQAANLDAVRASLEKVNDMIERHTREGHANG